MFTPKSNSKDSQTKNDRQDEIINAVNSLFRENKDLRSLIDDQKHSINSIKRDLVQSQCKIDDFKVSQNKTEKYISELVSELAKTREKERVETIQNVKQNDKSYRYIVAIGTIVTFIVIIVAVLLGVYAKR